MVVISKALWLLGRDEKNCNHQLKLMFWLQAAVTTTTLTTSIATLTMRTLTAVTIVVGKMIDDYGASSKEISESFMKALVSKIEEDLKDQNMPTRNNKHKEAIMAALDDQDTLIEELEEELCALQAELVAKKNKDDGGYSTPCEERDFYNDFASEGGIYNHESVMKEGRRRKRYKSRVCRTPYTGYSPKLD
ncbi:hypothetical protein LR48_Vigan11g096500 [Vigna angularis]|uniref:Uncharacterized protein n=1 Tax=Phaseolus angularis TaxID=3914 RepID=A0A0L9VSU2_PHAAN|nr:hypothetical protein LR48_Vigan11g096500 [Vigna angularis]